MHGCIDLIDKIYYLGPFGFDIEPEIIAIDPKSFIIKQSLLRAIFEYKCEVNKWFKKHFLLANGYEPRNSTLFVLLYSYLRNGRRYGETVPSDTRRAKRNSTLQLSPCLGLQQAISLEKWWQHTASARIGPVCSERSAYRTIVVMRRPSEKKAKLQELFPDAGV